MRIRERVAFFVAGLVSVSFLGAVISCKPKARADRRAFGGTLREYAARAKVRGSREAFVPYAFDEEEGSWENPPRMDDALERFEWIVGEPIEKKTLTFATISRQKEPDAIFTVYRVRVAKRMGKTKNTRALSELDEEALRQMPPGQGEVLVLKSGGKVVVDGVLLKKEGSPCFSELLPGRYLLAMQMDATGRVGWLATGCRSIFAVNGDRLTQREQGPNVVTAGMKDRFGDSLAAFVRAFQGSRN